LKTKFKETEIGMIPEDWEEIIFSEAVEINPKRELKKGSVAKSVGMEDIQPFARRISNYTLNEFKGGSKFKNGDTLFARITPSLENGKTAFVDILTDGETGFGSTEFIILAAKNGKTDPYYVHYLSRSPVVRNIAIKSMTGTSGRQRVENDVFDNITIYLPKIEEQQSIAKILSNLDSKIELNQQMNKTLEAIGKAIFKNWFIDFEFPNEEGKPYKSSCGEMVDSELGKIPKGWRSAKFSECVNVIKGCSYRSNDLKESQTALVTLKSINRGGGFNQGGYKEYVGEYSLDHTLKNGEIVVAQTDLTQKAEVIGRPAVVNSLGKYSTLVASLDLQIIRPKNNFSKYFIYCLLKTEDFHNHALSYTNGTTVLHLNKNAVPNYVFVEPQKIILDKFDDVIRHIHEKIYYCETEIQTLTNTKDLLLPKLMSGKIRVPIETS